MKRTTPLFCSFLVGIVFMLILGFTKEELAKTGLKEILKPGVFGNVRIITGTPKSRTQEALIISVGDYVFFSITKNDSNNITQCSIYDDVDRKLVEIGFRAGKFNKLDLICNDQKGVFEVEKANGKSVWQQAKYMGRNIRQKLAGVIYEDIDFNGHFDCKTVLNDDSQVVGKYVFINGIWEHVFNYNIEKLEAIRLFINGEYQKVLPTDKKRMKELSKFPQNAKEIIYYDFEFGKGWKRRKE